MEDNKFEKEIEFLSGEQTGLNLYFTLRGQKGAVTFTVWTRWEKLKGIKKDMIGSLGTAPYPSDLGYHSRKDNEYGTYLPKCHHLNGDECWYDGSTLQANDVFKILLEEGSQGVWKELEDRYIMTFGQDEE